jgi:hypothetical protein
MIAQCGVLESHIVGRWSEALEDVDKQQADSATAMRDVIDRWRDIALSEVSHQDVTGDGQPVAWWFDKENATTEAFMRALAGDPELVVPGKPADRQFLTRFLRPSRPMGKRLKDDRPTVEEWISDGAPVPEEHLKAQKWEV